MSVETSSSLLSVQHGMERDKGEATGAPRVHVPREVNSADGAKGRAELANVLVRDNVGQVGDADRVGRLALGCLASVSTSSSFAGALRRRNVLARSSSALSRLPVDPEALDLFDEGVLHKGLLEGTHGGPVGTVTVATCDVLQVDLGGLLVHQVLVNVRGERQFQENSLARDCRRQVGPRLVPCSRTKLGPCL